VPRGQRQAFFGGWRDVPVYALDALRPGHTLAGPAIIEAETTTVLIDTGDQVTVNALGWLDISLR
jgi:N-methylhydantoinase A